jgi:peptidyl-prolyl cis-trans isomerase B (cyclophilin B)
MLRFILILLTLLITTESANAWTSASIRSPASPASSSSTTTTSLSEHQRRGFLGLSILATTSIIFKPELSFASYIDPITDSPKITKRVYLDVEFGKTEKGRLVIGLYGDIMPKTTENFEKLCASNSYAGTNFYRVISDTTIQGGAIGDPSGKTGKSSFDDGKSFEPDNFNIKHTKSGILSMVKGIGGVDSRFFINTQEDAGWADDRYAAFGIVEEGMYLVKQIEKVPVLPPKNSPVNEVKILASGLVEDLS